MSQVRDGVSTNQSKNSSNDKNNSQEFSSLLLSTIKISTKNQQLRRRSKKTGSVKAQEEEIKVEEHVSSARKKLENFNIKLPVERIEEITENSSEAHVEQFSPILWFILSKTAIKNMLPDIDFIRLTDSKVDPKSSSNKTHEDFFNLGKLHCHESNFSQAIHNFTRAKNLAAKLGKYKVWKSMAMIKSLNTFSKSKERSSSCCSTRSNLSKRDFLMKIINKLVALPQTIETLWCLMEISILGVLTIGVEIEPARFYAAKIKKANEFFGFLAWCQINLKESSRDVQSLILELISNYANRPEPYYMAWQYFFDKKKYDRSREIAIEAFLKITSFDYESFYILFCLNLAKSYYYTGEFINCIELLHKKYVEHPNFPVFLYALSKYCVLSEDFAYAGLAKGNLRELLRLSDNSRRPNIYYYLFKSYWLTRQFPQSFKYAFKAIEVLKSGQKPKKRSETEKKMYELQPFVQQIQKIQEKINNRDIHQDDFKIVDQIRDFHRPTADLLTADLHYLLENKPESISILKTMISTSRLETSAYFKLIEYDQLNSENIFKGLLSRAKNSQIPTQVWVKANLLYSKFMFKSCHYNKCFYVLRILAKMLPPLPFLSLPYCLSLQTAENLQDLANSCTKINKDAVNRPNLMNLKEAIHKISEDSPLTPSIATAKRQKQVEGKKFKTFASLALNSERGELIDGEYLANGDLDVSSFFICSKPKFLYYIAKFSSKIGRNQAEGLLAIRDYMELLKLERSKEKRQMRMRKAEEVEIALGIMG